MKQLLLSMPGAGEWLVLIIIALLILVALKKFVMWYTGMSDLLQQSRKQTELLSKIAKQQGVPDEDIYLIKRIFK